jgi:hypothetical protein
MIELTEWAKTAAPVIGYLMVAGFSFGVWMYLGLKAFVTDTGKVSAGTMLLLLVVSIIASGLWFMGLPALLGWAWASKSRA